MVYHFIVTQMQMATSMMLLRRAYQSSTIIAYLLYHVQLAYIVLSSHFTVWHESEHISVFLRQPKVETFTFQHCFRIKPNTDGLIIASKHGLFELLVYPAFLQALIKQMFYQA